MQELYSSSLRVCRLCLSESEFQLPIFGESGQRLGIHFKIQSCFPTLQVIQQDGLPDSICYRCLFSLEQTYDFWSKCCTTEAILSKTQFKKNYQVIHEQKKISYQPREATFPYTADDTDWDEWFIWDATYKISNTENKFSQQMPITHHSKNEVNSTNVTYQPIEHEDINHAEMKKKSNKLFKFDFLQEDMPCKNENKDIMKIADSAKSTSKTNATNFSSSFWKQSSLNTKLQKYTNPLANSLYSSFGEFKEQVPKVSNLDNLERTNPNYFSQDKKITSKLLDQYECHKFSTNNDINFKENCPLMYNTSVCDDVLTNATNLLHRFRANNNLYY